MFTDNLQFTPNFARSFYFFYRGYPSPTGEVPFRPRAHLPMVICTLMLMHPRTTGSLPQRARGAAVSAIASHFVVLRAIRS